MSMYSILSEVITDDNLKKEMDSMNNHFSEEEFICNYIKEYPKDDFHRLLVFISNYGMTELLVYARRQLLPKTICRRLKLAHKERYMGKRSNCGSRWVKDL